MPTIVAATVEHGDARGGAEVAPAELREVAAGEHQRGDADAAEHGEAEEAFVVELGLGRGGGQGRLGGHRVGRGFRGDVGRGRRGGRSRGRRGHRGCGRCRRLVPDGDASLRHRQPRRDGARGQLGEPVLELLDAAFEHVEPHGFVAVHRCSPKLAVANWRQVSIG